MVYSAMRKHLGYANIFITKNWVLYNDFFCPVMPPIIIYNLKKPGYLIDIDNSDKTHLP
jgi:hypothetical protein